MFTFSATKILNLIPSSNDKALIVGHLKSELEDSKTSNLNLQQDIELFNSVRELRKFQAQRLSTTYSEMLLNPNTKDAAHFFLDNLYGEKDFSIYYKDLDTLLPTMEKVFPDSALRIIVKSLELNLLTEKLDIQLASLLGTKFTEKKYWKAYQSPDMLEQRLKQLALLQEIGYKLVKASKMPLISNLLSIMHGPAKKMGVLNLHLFLEEGFHVFKNMQNANEFIDTIHDTELLLLNIKK